MQSSLMEEHKGQFLAYLNYEKKYSAHTIKGYQTDLASFIQFVAGQFEVADTALVNHQHIRGWLVELMNDGLEARSAARKLSALRSFFKFLLKNDLVAKNPVAKVQAPKIGKKLPVFVEEGQMNKLFDNTTKEAELLFENGFEGIRNRLILLLFYSSGIRLSELIELKTADVNLYKQNIKVLGKRNKERIIPVPKELITEIENYLSQKRKLGLEDEFFFVLSSNKKLYPKMVYNLVKKYLSLVTTISKKSPHVLRHTYATHLLNHGADLNAIKELLGHASLAATQLYTHNSIERLKNIHKKRHPRA